MQYRYAAWSIFAIIAVTYTVITTIQRSRAQRDALLSRMEPFRAAFRTQYVAEEFKEPTNGDS